MNISADKLISRIKSLVFICSLFFIINSLLSADAGARIYFRAVSKPDTAIQVAERILVGAAVSYSGLEAGDELALCIVDLQSGSELGCDRFRLLTDEGDYNFNQIEIVPDREGKWYLDLQIKSRGKLLAQKQIEILVIMPEGPQPKVLVASLNVSKAKIVEGIPIPITVIISYENLLNNTRLRAYISDIDGKELGWAESSVLSGEGNYAFKPVIITPQRTGDMKLNITISSPLREYFNGSFSMKVSPPEPSDDLSMTERRLLSPLNLPVEPSVIIEKVIKKDDRIVKGIGANLMFRIGYDNLKPGTILNLIVADEQSGVILIRIESNEFEGNGTYTFDDISVVPAGTGEWQLAVEIRSGSSLLARGKFSLSVEDSADSAAPDEKQAGTVIESESEKKPMAEIIEIKYPVDSVSLDQQVKIEITILYSYFAAESTITAHFIDRNSKKEIARLQSAPLSGNGTLILGPVSIMPAKSGEWWIRLLLKYDGLDLTSKEFIIHVK